MLASINSSADAILKVWYQKAIGNMLYADAPLTAVIPKVHAGGETVSVTIEYGENAGRSFDFATALANQNNAQRMKLSMDWAEDHVIARVKKSAITLSQDNAGALVKMLSQEIKSTLTTITQNLERQIAASTGFNDLGVIASISTDTITWVSRTSALNFIPGAKYNFAQTVTSSTMRNSGNTATCVSTDRDAGTTTFHAGDLAALSAVTAGDVAFQQGDKTGSTSVGLLGIPAWVPLTAPAPGDSFGGKDRSVDPQRLAGVRVDGRGKSATDAVADLCVRVCEAGGNPDVGYSTYDFNQALVKEAQARRVFNYDEVKASNDIKVMFKGVTVVHPKGEIKMLAVKYAPSNAVRVLTTDDWELNCGEGTTPIFNPFMNGGQLDEPADDSVQIRHKLLACLTCMAPGHSGVAQIA